METIKNISLFIVVSIVVNLLSNLLASNFIPKFLAENLVLILIALMAINITTISVIMTKLKEIYDKFGGDFKSTIKSLKNSILEQVILVILSVVFYTLFESPVIQQIISFHKFLFDTLILTVFIYSIHILYDTACAIFVILDFEDKKNNK